MISALCLLAVAQKQVDTKDWKTFASDDKSYSIQAPKGWFSWRGNDVDSRESVDFLKANNPSLSTLFRTRAENTQLQLMQYSRSDFNSVRSMTVTILDIKTITTNEYPKLAKSGISQLQLYEADWKLLDLPCGQSVTFSGLLSLNLGEGVTKSVRLYQFLTAKKDRLYVSGFMVDKEADVATKPIFDAMVRSITIK